MTVLPIVERELRVASRRWGTYLLRLTSASIAIAMAVMVYIFSSKVSNPAAVGKTIFTCLSGFAFLYALLIGVRVTSDCISSEKRDGTLGLLFLTDLKGFDIVLGKLVAFSIDALYALLATLPVLAIPILMGSLTADELWRVGLCLIVTAVFSVCMGLFVSAISVKERKASSATFLIIAFVTAGIPLLGVIAAEYRVIAHGSLPYVMVLSPGTAIVTALVGQAPGVPLPMHLTSVAVTLGYAFLATLIATVIVPRVWHDTGTARKFSTRQTGDDVRSAMRARRQAMLDIGPTYWLSRRGHLRPFWIWLLMAFIAGCWLWGYQDNPNDMLNLSMNLVIMYFVQGIFKVVVASEAVRIYGEEDKQGALELVLCTPITVGEVLKGQLTSLRHYFQWPVLLLLAVDLFFILVGKLAYATPDDRRRTVIMFIMVAFVFLSDCVALALVGLWNGLVARNNRQAVTNTLASVLLLPWVLFLMITITAVLLDVETSSSTIFWLWVLLSLIVDILFGWRAWKQLSTNVRVIAANRFERGPAKWWSILGRWYGRWTARPSRD